MKLNPMAFAKATVLAFICAELSNIALMSTLIHMSLPVIIAASACVSFLIGLIFAKFYNSQL